MQLELMVLGRYLNLCKLIRGWLLFKYRTNNNSFKLYIKYYLLLIYAGHRTHNSHSILIHSSLINSGG